MKKEKSSKTTKTENWKPKMALEMTPQEYLKARGEVKSNSMAISMFPRKSTLKPSNTETNDD